MLKFISFVAAGLFASPVTGQSFQIDPSQLAATVAGTAFTLEKSGDGSPLSSSFSIAIPTDSNGGWVSRANQTPAIGIATFVFTSPEGSFVESLTFTTAEALEGEPTQQLEQLGAVLLREQVPQLTGGDTAAPPPRIRRLKLGELEAVELFGSYENPREGKLFYRYVAILHPRNTDAIVALSQTSAQRMAVEAADKLSSTLAGKALSSFKFAN